MNRTTAAPHAARTLPLSLAGVAVELAYSDFGNGGECLVYLHGLGSDRNDFLPVLGYPGISRFRLLLPDLPGHGGSSYPRQATVTVDAVATMLAEWLNILEINRVHLLGHSLGGAVGLRLAGQLGDRVASFINIEGNLVAEDAGILSREIERRPFFGKEREFFAAMSARLNAIALPGYREFAAGYRSRLNASKAWHDYCRSLITLSDSGELLDAFRELFTWRAYVYGADAPPSVVTTLAGHGTRLVPITNSSHWPMYSNPGEFFTRITALLQRALGDTP